MEYKITSHSDITSLEFELLEEMPKLRVLNSLITDDQRKEKEDFFRKVETRLKEITGVNRIFEVLHKTDSGCICSNDQYMKPFLFIRNVNMEVGEIYFETKARGYSDDNYVVKVNDELIDDVKAEEFFDKMEKWVEEVEVDEWGRKPRRYNNDLVVGKDCKKGEINFEIITKKFEEHKAEVLETEKLKIKREEKKQVEKELLENTEEALYNSTSKFKFNRLSVDDKTIKYNSKDFILDENVNKIFSYEEIKTIDQRGYGNNILSPIETSLNDRKITYTKKIDNNKTYKVSYSGDKCEINDVKIPSAKIKFVLNRIFYSGATKDELKVLVKLNGMKADFISLESITSSDGESLKIPIINKAIDDQTFEIEFIGKKKTFNWEEIKDMFYDRGRSRSISQWFTNDRLSRFCDTMVVEKKELFGALKRIKMLNALESEEDKD